MKSKILKSASSPKLALFGSTGSIGKQTLEVLRAFPGEFEVVGLTAFKNAELLAEQAAEFLPGAEPLKPTGEKSLPGQRLTAAQKRSSSRLTEPSAILAPTAEQIATLVEKADFIVNGVPGFDGLAISLAALKASTPQKPKILLSANKESFAIAGKFLRRLAEENGAELRPLDSEASAIWQLLQQYGHDETGAPRISSVTLTCSGGPFFGLKTKDLKSVTRDQALAHPTWKMGPKVSLDSATLINKVLEVYEVHNLFDVPLSKIKIVIHRQSVVHSMVHLKSKATRMHITQNDMRLFISYALHFPTQPPCPWPLVRTPKKDLDFASPDEETFRPLQWLHQHAGNPNFPIVLNALNDLTGKYFLEGKISFLEIYDWIERGLQQFLWEKPPQNLEDLLDFHARISESMRQQLEAALSSKKDVN